MKHLIWVPIISLLLEMIFSCFIPLNTNIYNCLFVLTSLIIICPYFSSKSAIFYKICLFSGFLYDIIMNNTLFLNSIVFATLGFLIYHIYQMISNHIITSVVITIVIIILYRLVSFILLLFIGYLKWDILKLIHSITSSFLLNVIYAILIYYIVRYIAKKLKIIKFY